MQTPKPKTAALFLLALIGGLMRDALLTGEKLTNNTLVADAFIAELKRVVSGYVQAETPANQGHARPFAQTLT